MHPEIVAGAPVIGLDNFFTGLRRGEVNPGGPRSRHGEGRRRLAGSHSRIVEKK